MSSKDLTASATTNPSTQAAVRGDAVSALQTPPLQTSAREVVISAAKSAASQGAAHAKTGFVEVRRYVQENPNSVRAISFCIALALLVFSVLGVVNVFDAVFKP